jgi:hypothetical protein
MGQLLVEVTRGLRVVGVLFVVVLWCQVTTARSATNE